MSKELMAILEPILGDELAKDLIAHRKGMKVPLTPRGAKALLKQYELAGNPVAAAEHHLNMGWRGFDVAWLKGKGFSDPHNPMPVAETSEERNRRIYLQNELRWAKQEGDKAKIERLSALIERSSPPAPVNDDVKQRRSQRSFQL